MAFASLTTIAGLKIGAITELKIDRGNKFDLLHQHRIIYAHKERPGHGSINLKELLQ